MQIYACAWIYHCTKKRCGKSGLGLRAAGPWRAVDRGPTGRWAFGPSGRRAVASREPRAFGPLSLRAFGPSGRRAVAGRGPQAAGLRAASSILQAETGCRSVHSLGFTTAQKNTVENQDWAFGPPRRRAVASRGPRAFGRPGRRAVSGRGPRVAGLRACF